MLSEPLLHKESGEGGLNAVEFQVDSHLQKSCNLKMSRILMNFGPK